jgi:hypothetical protein
MRPWLLRADQCRTLTLRIIEERLRLPPRLWRLAIDKLVEYAGNLVSGGGPTNLYLPVVLRNLRLLPRPNLRLLLQPHSGKGWAEHDSPCPCRQIERSALLPVIDASELHRAIRACQ